MKISVWLLALVTLFSVAKAQPRKLTAESSISDVTVFSAGAQILRVASVSVVPGRTEISFTGLSNQLEQQSLQLKADANITLLSVQAVKDYTGQRKLEADEKSLTDRRAELQDRLGNDSRLLLVFRKEEEMLTKNQSIGGQGGVKAEELKQALDLHRVRTTEVLQKQLELEKRMAATQREIEKLQAQLREVGKKRDSVNYTVTALIDSRETQNIKFQLLYTVKDAGWYPTYDVRVTDVGRPLNMTMNANIFQRSGETWKDVAVQLSTGNPADNATPSSLQPWHLGFNDPSVSWRGAAVPGVLSGRVVDESGNAIAGASVMMSGTNAATQTDGYGFFKLQNLMAGRSVSISVVGYKSKQLAARAGYVNIVLAKSDGQLEEVVVTGYGLQGRAAGLSVENDESKARLKDSSYDMETVAVTTAYQPTAVVYQIAEKYSFETEGRSTTIPIKRTEIPALYQYVTAPKIDPAAFLHARIVNWQEYDLQPGETNLYYEGTFLGKTYLDLSGVGDTLSLSLGKDNGVKVVRKLLKEYSTQRFIGNSRTETRDYAISVMNTKKVPVSIVVQEQFPVTTIKEIEVKDKSAPEAEVDESSGMVKWLLTLAPGAEKKLRLTYSVKYPKDRRSPL